MPPVGVWRINTRAGRLEGTCTKAGDTRSVANAADDVFFEELAAQTIKRLFLCNIVV